MIPDDAMSNSRTLLGQVAAENGISIGLLLEYARMKLASEGGAQNHPFDKLKRPKDFWLHYANATGVKLAKG